MSEADDKAKVALADLLRPPARSLSIEATDKGAALDLGLSFAGKRRPQVAGAFTLGASYDYGKKTPAVRAGFRLTF